MRHEIELFSRKLDVRVWGRGCTTMEYYELPEQRKWALYLYLCICTDCNDAYLPDSCTWRCWVMKFMRITSASWDDSVGAKLVYARH